MVDNKTTYIRCRVDDTTKEKWIQVCKKNAVNGSELLRQWIDKYIEDNTRKDDDKNNE